MVNLYNCEYTRAQNLVKHFWGNTVYLMKICLDSDNIFCTKRDYSAWRWWTHM